MRCCPPVPRRMASVALLVGLALGTIPTSASGQLQTLILDTRDPLELNIGNDLVNDLVLIGALFDATDGIRVFSGPADGQGPYSEEIVVANGVPFFALSRKIHCREGLCYFTGVNGNTLNVELFIRNPSGVWIRQQITGQGVYFNSEACLTKESVTILAFDAVAGEHELWRGTTSDLMFSQVAVRPDTTDGIFGGTRASLSCDPDSFDFVALIEEDDPTPTPPRPTTGEPTPLGPTTRGVYNWAAILGHDHWIRIDERTLPLSGTPSEGTESYTERLGDKAWLDVHVREDGEVLIHFYLSTVEGQVETLYDGSFFQIGAGESISVTTISQGVGQTVIEIRWPPSNTVTFAFIDDLSNQECSAQFLQAGQSADWQHLTPATLGSMGHMFFASRGSVELRRYEDSGLLFVDSFESGTTNRWSQTMP